MNNIIWASYTAKVLGSMEVCIGCAWKYWYGYWNMEVLEYGGVGMGVCRYSSGLLIGLPGAIRSCGPICVLAPLLY